MSHRIQLLFASLLFGVPLFAAQYPVTALILKVDMEHHTFVASSTAIPGYMDAMVMPFKVRDSRLLNSLKPSMLVDFSLVVTANDSYADNLHIRHYQSFEQEPSRVRRLQLLTNASRLHEPRMSLELGQRVNDFALTDQTGQRVRLSQFAGKVVALDFIYTSCPLPNYCLRLSNNFGRLQKRFASQLGKDLILLSVTFDPAHDRPSVLAGYAKNWKANPDSWHFLTGSLNEVQAVCQSFGLNFWPDEGTMTHSLHTVIIDREGRLAANLEGNEFTSTQLGDLIVSTLLDSSKRL